MENNFYMDISIEDEEYIVKSFKNQEKPKDEQMKVILKQFSGKDLNYIVRLTTNAIIGDVLKKGYKHGTLEYNKLFLERYNIEVKKWEFVHRIKELINFKFKVDGEIKEFKDAEELYEYPNERISQIVQEISLHFDGFDNLNLKN